MLRAISTGKNYNRRGGARTTLGGQRPGGASGPTRSGPKPTRLASTDTDTDTDTEKGDEPKPKSGLPNKGPKIKDVALYVVSKNGMGAEHTKPDSLAHKLLNATGSNVNVCVDVRDVGKLAETLDLESRPVCVLVDLDSYDGSELGSVMRGLTSAMSVIKGEYTLIIKTDPSNPSSVMSDLKQIKEHAMYTDNPEANRIIYMHPRRVIIVHDSSRNPADVWARSGLDDGTYYELVGINCGNTDDAGRFADVVTRIERACTKEPRPCVVLFQCEKVNLFLVALHATFLSFVDRTRVHSLVDDATSISKGYAYNLYDADKPGVIVDKGAPKLTLVGHTPLKVAEDVENGDVVVIGKVGASVSPSHDDKAGIYGKNGAAHIIRDARESNKDASGNDAPIAGGFKVHLTTVRTFPNIESNFLVYADLSDVTEAVINEATSKIKGRYRLLVRQSGSKEATVPIRGAAIETGKIIQMEPGPAAAQTKPVDALRASGGSSAQLGHASASTAGSHAAPPQPQKAHVAHGPRTKSTIVVIRNQSRANDQTHTDYIERVDAYADAHYQTETETYGYHKCSEIKSWEPHHLAQYTKLVFWFTGDTEELAPIYSALVAICEHATDLPKIHLVYTGYAAYSRTMPLPYHMYSENNRTTDNRVVTIELKPLPLSSNTYTAVVVRPAGPFTAGRPEDPMIVNMMVHRLQSKLKRTGRIMLQDFKVSETDKLKHAVTSAVNSKGSTCCVLLLDEDDGSLDVLDAIYPEPTRIVGDYRLFVVGDDDKGDRLDRKDTKFSGWVRDNISTRDVLAGMPVQNEILRLVTNNEIAAYAADATTSTQPVPLAYVVTVGSDYATPRSFVETYDYHGKLRKLICRGKTHAFVYKAKTANGIVLPQLNETAVLVIAVFASPLIRQDSLDKLNCRVLINAQPKKKSDEPHDNQNLVDQIMATNRYELRGVHKMAYLFNGSETSYVELMPKSQANPAFGMMGQFV